VAISTVAVEPEVDKLLSQSGGNSNEEAANEVVSASPFSEPPPQQISNQCMREGTIGTKINSGPNSMILGELTSMAANAVVAASPSPKEEEKDDADDADDDDAAGIDVSPCSTSPGTVQGKVATDVSPCSTFPGTVQGNITNNANAANDAISACGKGDADGTNRAVGEHLNRENFRPKPPFVETQSDLNSFQPQALNSDGQALTPAQLAIWPAPAWVSPSVPGPTAVSQSSSPLDDPGKDAHSPGQGVSPAQTQVEVQASQRTNQPGNVNQTPIQWAQTQLAPTLNQVAQPAALT